MLRFFALFLALAGGAFAGPPVDWPAFLGRHDLVWSTLPARWEESAFLGNGNLGATIHLRDGALAWEVNRADFYHRGERYAMGRVALRTAGRITGGDLRLDLWNAEARGTVLTDRGEVRWRSFVATEPAVIVIEFEGMDGEIGVGLDWQPALARPTRKTFRQEAYSPAELHPVADVETSADGFFSLQRFNDGDEAFAVASQSDTAPAGHGRIALLAIGCGASPAAARADARTSLSTAAGTPFAALLAAHRAWWHAWYPLSFLSVPDARLESFYWIQIYKLGAAMRPDGPILDLMGPWFRPTAWSKIWWNLNVQLTYHPLTAANRLDLAESLFRNLDRNRDQLVANVRPARSAADAAAINRASDQTLRAPVDLAHATGEGAREAGNLPWVMFLYWEFYRYQMDDAVLRDRVFPLLALAVGHYLAHLETGPEGSHHLPPTYSPEFAAVPDANYDLALLRWGLETLIGSCERLSLEDARLPRWREVLARLGPFPVDTTGLMIGRGLPLSESHRHYSHLLAIYPLHLLRADLPADRALIARSLAHWEGMPQKLAGYSHTGAASIHALLGDGDAALRQLNLLLDRRIHPNTLYTEGGGPVIETPLSVASSLQEMLLQSWGGVLRVFPAVPAPWSDTTFSDLRSEGAFLVSAVRHEGQTRWVKIQSLAGEPCRIQVPGWTRAVIRAQKGPSPQLIAAGDGTFTLTLARGASVVLAPSDDTPLPPATPVNRRSADENPYPQRYR